MAPDLAIVAWVLAAVALAWWLPPVANFAEVIGGLGLAVLITAMLQWRRARRTRRMIDEAWDRMRK